MPKREFDIGIIVPLAEEYRFITEVVRQIECIPQNGTFFYQLDFQGVSAVCCIAGQAGILPASSAAHRLLGFANIKLLVVLGLGGALDNDVAVGDVVIAEEINEFQANSKAKAGKDQYIRQYSGRHWRLGYTLREAISNFEFSCPIGFKAWRTQAAADFQALDIPGKNDFCPRPTAMYLGPLASGDVVVASKAFSEEIKGIDRKFLAVDMESAGVASAAIERPHPINCLVVRGISDHSDENKSALEVGSKGAWRRYCVRNAASYFKELLKWEDFLVAAGIRHESEPDSIRLVKRLVLDMTPCLGGAWIVGVAFDVYNYGPRILGDQAAIPMDVSRLQILDPKIKDLIDAASSEKEDLLASGDSSKSALRFARLIESFRNSIGRSDVDTLLANFDTVVQETLNPKSDDEDITSILLQAERVHEDGGPGMVATFLQEHIGRGPSIRERYLDAIAEMKDWQKVLDVVARYPTPTLSRREMEHVIFASFETGRSDVGGPLLEHHSKNFVDRAGIIFRQELTRRPLDGNKGEGNS